MRDATDITVTRAIVHIVDHRTSNEPVLSEAELALDANQKLQEYFRDQIINVLQDAPTSAAKFTSANGHETVSHCYQILASPTNATCFIDSSQHLAQQLFQAMGTDGRIAPGSLAVCVYDAKNYPNLHFLALMKIDPSEMFVQHISRDTLGHRIVNLEPRDDVMPTARERLQKAALLRPKDAQVGYDLLLLDRQVARVAANFFAQKFLGAEPVMDARKRTDLFYIGAQNAYNRLTAPPTVGGPHLEPEQADAFQQHIHVALQGGTIDLAPWVDSLPVPENAKAILHEEIGKKLPTERQVAIDPTYAEKKLLKRLRFRGDFGVILEIQADHYNDVVKHREDIPQPDGQTITRLTLEVRGLQWVKK